MIRIYDQVKGKSVAIAAAEPRGKSATDEKGRRPNWRTREAMDFNPKLTPLSNPRDIFEYLAKNGVQLPPEIMVEWCPLRRM